MTLQTPNSIQFTQSEIDKVFHMLLSSDDELKSFFGRYLEEEYKDDNGPRLYYFDIAQIGRNIVDKIKRGQTGNFQSFFEKVENILKSCDSEIENLIVVGLFEGIQNIGGSDINYYTAFDKWLSPISKRKWDNLIDFWEGKNWRTKRNKKYYK